MLKIHTRTQLRSTLSKTKGHAKWLEWAHEQPVAKSDNNDEDASTRKQNQNELNAQKM